MGWPFTSAQTSGPGATLRWHAAPARVSASSPPRVGRPAPWDHRRPSSGSLGDPARPQARGADPHAAPYTVDDRPHAAQIRLPAPPRDVVRVADGIAVLRTPTANF